MPITDSDLVEVAKLGACVERALVIRDMVRGMHGQGAEELRAEVASVIGASLDLLRAKLRSLGCM